MEEVVVEKGSEGTQPSKAWSRSWLMKDEDLSRM